MRGQRFIPAQILLRTLAPNLLNFCASSECCGSFAHAERPRFCLCETIGRQCAERRGFPEHNLRVLPLPRDEPVSREAFDTQIEQPIWTCIANGRAQDRVLYIVLTKDVPIRIKGSVAARKP